MGYSGRFRFGIAALISVCLFLLYCCNGDFQPADDPTASACLPLNILAGNGLAFTPTRNPLLFDWDIDGPPGPVPIWIGNWDRAIDGHKLSEWRSAGRLHLHGPRYFVVESRRLDAGTGERLYVNTFGIGAGLTALPFYAALGAAIPDVAGSPWWLWYGSKIVAALAVAISGGVAFYISTLFLGWRSSVLLSLAYGMGTDVWSVSSQNLWQHGPAELFLALGTYLYCDRQKNRMNTTVAGICFGMAALCRPPCIIFLACVGVDLAWKDWRACLKFAIGAISMILAMAYYNAYYFDSPFTFGQTLAAIPLAVSKTGQPNVWQTPLWLGLSGVLISPSRGLLIFSPILLFSFIGIPTIWKSDEYSPLRPLLAGTLFFTIQAALFFDWWGGWSYGYRHLVDISLFLVLFLIPVVPTIARRKSAKLVFALLLIWSVAVQFIGAFAYDFGGWDAERIAGGARDIDLPENRNRLWSLRDNEILYYATHFEASREAKKRSEQDQLNPS